LLQKKLATSRIRTHAARLIGKHATTTPHWTTENDRTPYRIAVNIMFTYVTRMRGLSASGLKK
jgi:hypothetical protein